MTDYNKWDKKASELVKDDEEDDKKAKEENDKALGLTDGPKGPPTAKAEQQMKELGGHSEKRKEFIDWSNEREVKITHPKQDETMVLNDEKLKGKAVRLVDCEDVTYVVPEDTGAVKLMLDNCKRVRITLKASLVTSTLELCRCDDVRVELEKPLGTLQVDECVESVTVLFAERDHVNRVYHQNSPGLKLGWSEGELFDVGLAGAAQFVTGLNNDAGAKAGKPLVTEPVRRGEGEFPVNMSSTLGAAAQAAEPDAEAPPAAEERRKKAEEKRLAGNDMFRANDFMQAALQYTEALGMDPDCSTVLANRAQCWLKVGDHDKALADAVRCTEIDPTNPKGWFRKGMSLHAMKKFPEAIPALLEAEKLDANNKQIPEAIKMAQLMARKQASEAK